MLRIAYLVYKRYLEGDNVLFVKIECTRQLHVFEYKRDLVQNSVHGKETNKSKHSTFKFNDNFTQLNKFETRTHAVLVA